MPNWRSLPLPKRGSTSRSWQDIIQDEPLNPLPRVPKTKQKHVRTQSLKRTVFVDVVEGLYEPTFLYCADCGRSMVRQLDTWQCWCGRSVENLTSKHHVKKRKRLTR